MTRRLALGFLLLGLPGVAGALPATPADVTCPPGATRSESRGPKGTLHIRCQRPDGHTLGPQTDWHPNGTLDHFSRYVEDAEGTALHGREVFFRPDGVLSYERQWDRGVPTGGTRVLRSDGSWYTQLFDAGALLDVFPGDVRPAFACPAGRVPRTRTGYGSSIGSTGARPGPRPAVEHWCEDAERPLVFPLRERGGFYPAQVRCRHGKEGIVSFQLDPWRSGRSERRPAPPDLDASDSEAITAPCADPAFWRERLRDGPYVSRGAEGEPLEEGRFLRGRRHGIWRIHGHACIRYEHGRLLGRAPCPEGPPAPDPWVDAQWKTLDEARRELGWPPLDARADGSRELRIWLFVPRHPMLGVRMPGARALRLVEADDRLSGELAMWEPAGIAREHCHRWTESGVCTFSEPSGWSWDDVRYELDLLDAWTLPPAGPLRIPRIKWRSGDERAGFFLEARVGDRVHRDWYGPLAFEPAPETHQIRGIQALVDAVWRHALEEPPPKEPVATAEPCDPWVEIDAPSARVRVGEPFRFTLRARARYGLQLIWWGSMSGPAPAGPARERSFWGAGKARVAEDVSATFEKPGRAVLFANARDARYGRHYGAAHQASEGCGPGRATVEVVVGD